MEMSGSVDAFRAMLEVMNYGGRVAFLGVPAKEFAIDWTQVIFKGLNIKGIYGREMFETWYKMSTMLQSGLDVSGVLTHRFPADDFEKAFEIVRQGQSGKVILEW
jgi:threonine 3-dehydrogenase